MICRTDARALGAVNTVVLRDGRRIGHNTDWSGFAEGVPPRPAGGGAAAAWSSSAPAGPGAAVAHAALTLGTGRLVVFDVEAARAGRAGGGTRRALRRGPGAGRRRPRGRHGGGRWPDQLHPGRHGEIPGLPLPAALLRPALWVAEVIYFPLETALLRTARALGCRTLDGGGMAVFQAVGAFRLFTGPEPDAERMLRHFAGMVDQPGVDQPGFDQPGAR